MKTESDTIFQLQKGIPRILAGYPVMLAYLYGSVVDGDVHPASDVDIALVIDPDRNFSAYERMQIEFDIAAEVERRCGVKEADVRSLNMAPLTVQGKVITEGILLFSSDDEFRVQYEVHIRKLYFDFLPVMEMMRTAFFDQVQEEGLIRGKTR